MKTSIDNSIRSLFQMLVVVKDISGECTIVDHNKELSNIPKTDRFADLCKSLVKDSHPGDRDELVAFTDHDTYVEALSQKIHVSFECRLRHADGMYYWSEIIICNTTAEDSTEGNDCLLLIRDINDRKLIELAHEAEERAVFEQLQDKYETLFEENMTDQQTGCYNRKGLKYYTDIILEDARRNDKYLFVCVADLNGLKYLNDTFGHAAGDEAIAAVSGILKMAAPSGSKIIRTGGDEFLIIASLDKDSTEPGEFGDRVDKGLEEYNAKRLAAVKDDDKKYTVGASYGWILEQVRPGMTNIDEYIAIADQKMYEMKELRDEHKRD